MCGIVGMISKNTSGFYQSDLKVFKEMLWADQLRGVDGTGVFLVNKEGKVEVAKDAVPASSFITHQMTNVDKGIIQEARIVIGHNRAATKGTKIKANTHPFTENKVTLVHNGTLYTHKHLADVEVDSHAICHSMSSKGYVKTLKELWGAFALVWFNEQNKHLYLARNKERPLNIVETKDMFIISSEPGLATWILERNNEKILKITELKPEKIYSFNLEKLDLFQENEVKYRKEYKSPFPPKIHQDSTRTTTGTTGTTKVKEPTFGELIEFSPVKLYWHNQKPLLLGLFQRDEIEIDIEYYGDLHEYASIKSLEDEIKLTGIITQKKRYPQSNQEVWVLRDVKRVPEWRQEELQKEEIFISKNETVLSKTEKDNLDHTVCDLCGGFVNMRYLNEMIIDRNNSGAITTMYCHKCSKHAQKYGI